MCNYLSLGLVGKPSFVNKQEAWALHWYQLFAWHCVYDFT